MLIFMTNYFFNEELSQKLRRIEIVRTVYKYKICLKVVKTNRLKYLLRMDLS
jgi:hypothetical protein